MQIQRHRYVTSATISFVTLLAGSVPALLGADSDPPAAATGKGTATPPSPGAAKSPAPRIPLNERKYSPKLVGRESRQLLYLAEQIQSETTLSDEDKTLVRRRIQHYVDRMTSGLIDPVLYDGPSPDDLEKPEGSPTPNTDGTPSTGKGARAGQGRKGLKEKPPASPLSTHFPLLRDIEASLNAEPRTQFQTVTFRWNTLRYHGGPDGPLSRLMRAVRDPKLGLPEEKTNSLRTTAGAIMTSVKAARRDKDVMEAAFREAKEKISAELTPEQVKQLDVTLAELEKERTAENDLAKKIEQDRKDPSKSKPTMEPKKTTPPSPGGAAEPKKPSP